MNNREKAEQGRTFAAAALLGSGKLNIDYGDYSTGLVDALTNLMHFARRHGLDFEECIRYAGWHHEIEATYGWTEETGIDPKTPVSPENPLV